MTARADLEDVKATYDRIAKPPPGSAFHAASCSRRSAGPARATNTRSNSSCRSPPDRLRCRRSPAVGTSSRKDLEDNNYNLRKLVTYPGTGPFRSVAASRTKSQSWSGTNYWNKGYRISTGSSSITCCRFRRK
jgi:hypothetical protein